MIINDYRKRFWQRDLKSFMKFWEFSATSMPLKFSLYVQKIARWQQDASAKICFLPRWKRLGQENTNCMTQEYCITKKKINTHPHRHKTLRQRLGKLVEEQKEDEDYEEEEEGEGEATEAKNAAVSCRFQEYNCQGSIGGRQRQHMMSRVLFTATWSELKYVDMFTSLNPDDIIKLHCRPI